MWRDRDFYGILDVDSSATDEEIKSAYRSLALRYHPDTSAAHMTQLFRDVQEAYEVLSDPDRRVAYDRWRRANNLTGEHKSRIQIAVTGSHEILTAQDEPQMFYVIVDVMGTQSAQPIVMPLNLCLVLDRSTSMKGERLLKVKEATREIIDQLNERDILSVVAFSDRAQVIIPGRSDMDKMQCKSLVSGVQAGGGTEVYQGLLAGMKLVHHWRSSSFINHLILLTDGQTYGDEQQCLQLAEEASQRNIGISTIGIGDEWNDRLLDDMAQRSGGGSFYLANPNGIARIFQERVRDLASTLAHQISLTIQPADKVTLKNVFRLTPALGHLTSNSDHFSLGPLGSQAGQSILIEFLLPTTAPGRQRIARLEVAVQLPGGLQDADRLAHEVFVNFASEIPKGQEVPQRITAAAGRVAVFRMQERAMKEVDSGRVSQATQLLQTIAGRLSDMGEAELARAARLEADRLQKTGTVSAEGRKTLKYGTRSLIAEAWATKDHDDDTMPKMRGHLSE